MTSHKKGLYTFSMTKLKIGYHSGVPQVLQLWKMTRRNVDTKLADKAGVGCNERPPVPTAERPNSKVTVFLYLLNG